MTDRAHIAELLRGHDRVKCIDKKYFEVQLKTPVQLVLQKDGIYTGAERVIPYNEGVSYLNGLLGTRQETLKWSKEETHEKTKILAKLYGHRLLSVGDNSFDLDHPMNPTLVSVSRTGVVRIFWSDGTQNVYDYDDCIQSLTEYGPSFVANVDFTSQATMAEIEANPTLMKKMLGPAYPQPPHISNEAMRESINAKEPIMAEEKAYWYHPESDCVFMTKPGEDITTVTEQCNPITKKEYKKFLKEEKKKIKLKDIPAPEPKAKKKGKGKDKTKKASTPRGKGLGEGGKPLDEKTIKKAKKATESLTQQGKKIRLLITEYDADNDSIQEILECDEKAVQRTRRAIRREQTKKED